MLHIGPCYDWFEGMKKKFEHLEGIEYRHTTEFEKKYQRIRVVINYE